MKNALIIIGVLAVTGGVAYFIMKKGKLNAQSTPEPNMLGGMVISPNTPEGIAQAVNAQIAQANIQKATTAENEQALLQKANPIAVKIRGEYSRLKVSEFHKKITRQAKYDVEINEINARIKALKSDLNKLGYVFDGTNNGTIRKV
jgi:hypothetical protein